jgi:NAD+ kinase
VNKPVKKIALVANAAKPAARRIVQRAAKLAAAAGMKPITDEAKAHSADLVMVFGGDGTMLQWARNTAGSGTPIFGVNIGGMGFLTAVSGKDLAKAIRSISAREFSVESRTLLSATGEADGGRFRLDAMNDFVISRGSVPRMIRLEVKVNGEVLTVYRCDGLVVSSATGSTAYSLAAGGAIVAPDAGVFSITPICPHTLSNRAVIVGQQSTVEVRVLDRQREATLSADGRDVVELAADNPVMIRRSRRTVKLARLPDSSFFKTLRQKLQWMGSHA